MVGAAMAYWWVNQNQTYKSEVHGGFLWSPKTTASGSRNQFYENMQLVQPGDIVFSFSDTYIKAVGVALARADTSIKPNFGSVGSSWADEGWLVPVEFRELRNQIRPKDHMATIEPTLPAKYSPLQKNGNGLQGVYLAAVPDGMAAVLIELLGSEYRTAARELTDMVKSELEDNSAEYRLSERTDIGPTVKSQLVNARRGQGVFKANVRLYESRCRVTGVDDLSHLRASHIKPWSMSDDAEKLSGSNGLLLAPHIDHLFDKGYISFADGGQLIVSDQLDASVLDAWGMRAGVDCGEFNSDQKRFLAFHRNHIFRKSM
jgi:putative restriction endonuclease